MSKNLIQNPSFGKDWEEQKSHSVLICRDGEPPYIGEVGNIFSPPDWLPWYCHNDKYAQPEVRDAWKVNDHRRVRSGDKAILFFTFYKRHKGGFLQQVDVQSGQRLKFTMWAHAWSNNKDPNHPENFPHPDDGRWSEGAGYQEIAWVTGTQPSDTGDPQQDARANFNFAVGIDPTGGSNPLADTVVWGEHYHIYNGYCQQLSVEATARAGKVTVFLYSDVLWPFKHCDFYGDDAELVVVDTEPPAYESTMLILPQDATSKQLSEILAVAYPNRRTFGFSHDDAGRLNGTAILYNIPDDEKLAYLGFYTTRYPAVTVEFAYTSDWEEPPPPPSDLLVWQCDPQWKNEKVAGPDCAMTLCQTGCWISDCAMAQRFFGIKPDATPSTANKALGAVGGFSGCLTLWSGMKTALGLEVFEKTYDHIKAQDWLDGGYVCFAEVAPGSNLHFVLVTKSEHGHWWMYDPYKNVTGFLDDYYPGVESWRLIRPFEETPPMPPPISGSLVSLHLQQMVPGVLDFVARVKPSVIKIFQLENARAIKAASPNTRVVLRYYTGNQNLSGNLRTRAEEYVRSFRDSLITNAEWIDYVESYNEEIPTHDVAKTKLAVEFDCHFADVLMELGLPVAPQLLNVAVGNPSHEGGEIELMLPAVEKAVQYNGALGYHCFASDTDILTEQGWVSLAEVAENKIPISIATLNQETGSVEYQAPTEYHAYDYNGEMIHLHGKVDALVTPNHRMWVRTHCQEQIHPGDHHTGFEFVEAKDLPDTFEVKRDLGKYEGMEKDTFILPAYSKEWMFGEQPFKIYYPEREIPMDAWLAFFGFWVTEGHVCTNTVGITQMPGETLDKIITAVAECGFEYSVYDHKNRPTKQVNILRPAQLERYLRQFGKAKDKFIPRWMLSLSKQQLSILFEAMMLGDGSRTASPYFCTASPQLADDFQELALKLGYITMIGQHCDGYFYVSLGSDRKTPRTKKEYVHAIEYTGKVYCVTVPNGLVFVRRNGKPSWQGNSYGLAVSKSNLNANWEYYAGRALEGWDPVFRANGLYPKYIFGECGAFATCSSGWRSSECLGGDWPLYLSQLVEFSNRIKAWNATHGNRCLGGTLFTSGGFNWPSWEITETEMRDPGWPK